MKRGPILVKFNPGTKNQILKDENAISEEIQAYLKNHYYDSPYPLDNQALRKYMISSLRSREGKRSRWTA